MEDICLKEREGARETIKEFAKAGTLLEISRLDGSTVHREPVAAAIEIPPEGNYTAVWNTKEVSPGVYQVFPDSWGRPLKRIITVLLKEPTKKDSHGG